MSPQKSTRCSHNHDMLWIMVCAPCATHTTVSLRSSTLMPFALAAFTSLRLLGVPLSLAITQGCISIYRSWHALSGLSGIWVSKLSLRRAVADTRQYIEITSMDATCNIYALSLTSSECRCSCVHFDGHRAPTLLIQGVVSTLQPQFGRPCTSVTTEALMSASHIDLDVLQPLRALVQARIRVGILVPL